MEPITLAAAFAALTAVASGITAGATGKLGEGLVTAALQWLAQLQQHVPETVKRLAAVSDPNMIDVEILEEVKQVAAAQPDVRAAMNKTVAAVADSDKFPNLTKLADKIANVNFGTITTQNNTFNF
ncbi:hypothetical protein [Leptolyngbya sp. BC1307]|uniref:hypothetical protein n=1 Tax=Leptolyngbya sp. BC1307 TaxID=2029589 RepID=UPI000EFC3298|nr:hypothetical protein [Leptolyngbya sp. BC1307]